MNLSIYVFYFITLVYILFLFFSLRFVSEIVKSGKEGKKEKSARELSKLYSRENFPTEVYGDLFQGAWMPGLVYYNDGYNKLNNQDDPSTGQDQENTKDV